MRLIFFVMQKFAPFSRFIILGAANVFFEKLKASFFSPFTEDNSHISHPICMKFGWNLGHDVHIESPEWQDWQTAYSTIKYQNNLGGWNFVGVVVIRIFLNSWLFLPKYAYKIIYKNIETCLGPNIVTLAFIWIHLVTCWDTVNTGNTALKLIVRFFSNFRWFSGTFFHSLLCSIGKITPSPHGTCTWLL